MLTRLIYASRAADGVGVAEIRSIIDAASRNNVTNGVTGMLCFDRINFFQCLEGGRAGVNQIYNKIITDPRHQDVTLVEYSEIDSRSFSNWSMAYVSAQEDSVKALIKNYSANDSFRPHELHTKQAGSLIQEFNRILYKESRIEVLNQ